MQTGRLHRFYSRDAAICYNQSVMREPIGLYIHFPFCRRRCNYCSFVSYENREPDIPVYLECLKREISLHAGRTGLKSIYFGGGTPSLITAGQFSELLHCIRQAFVMEQHTEITVEINPGTLVPGYLNDLKSCGVNRLSIGMQSLNDDELRLLGRLHDADEALRAYRSACDAGYENINLDLIYGLPGQSIESWQQTLNLAASLDPRHLSLYCLSLETKARLAEEIEAGLQPPLDPDAAAGQYELAEGILEKRGYCHYEISNWAKPGYECRHNLSCWLMEPYLGLGASASSYLNNRRRTNIACLDQYISLVSSGASVPAETDEEIKGDLKQAEAIILSLRLEKGVDIAGFNHEYGIDLLDCYHQRITELEELGLIRHNENSLLLTPAGRLLGNEVFWRFLPEQPV